MNGEEEEEKGEEKEKEKKVEEETRRMSRNRNKRRSKGKKKKKERKSKRRRKRRRNCWWLFIGKLMLIQISQLIFCFPPTPHSQNPLLPPILPPLLVNTFWVLDEMREMVLWCRFCRFSKLIPRVRGGEAWVGWNWVVKNNYPRELWGEKCYLFWEYSNEFLLFLISSAGRD